MKAVFTSHNCKPSVATMLAVALVGCGIDAYAQDPVGTVPITSDPTISLLLDLLGRGGLPFVMVYLAWQARGLVANMTITIELSDKTMRKLSRILKDPDADSDH